MIKLGRLKLNNFKSFHEKFFDFRSLDVVIFDGPNGYGKTSIFDAIEFCITRNISRIKEIDNKVKSTPLLRLDKKLKGILNLEIIENESTKVILELVIPVIDIKSHKDNIAHEVYFYEKWEDIGNAEKRKNVESLQDFFNIENLDQLFTIFNYIQQEDSLHFLKVDETKRHKKIDFLFGIDKQKYELNKIKKFENILNTKCSEVFKELNDLKNKIDSFKVDILVIDKVKYKSIFFNKIEKHSNDVLNIYLSDFKNILRLLLLSKDYANFKIMYFVRSNLDNYKYNNILIIKDYSGFDQLSKKKKRLKWLVSLKEKNDYYKYIYSQLNESLNSFLNLILNSKDQRISLIVSKNSKAIEDYLDFLNKNSNLNSVLEEINFQRSKLFTVCKSHVDDSVCPLCGTQFDNSNDLSDSLDRMSHHLRSLSLDYEKNIDDLRDEIYKKVIDVLGSLIEIHFKRFSYLSDYLHEYEKFDVSESEFIKLKELEKKIHSFNYSFNQNESFHDFFEKYKINEGTAIDSTQVENFDYICKKYNLEVSSDGYIYKNNIVLSKSIIDNELFSIENQIKSNIEIEFTESGRKYNSVSLYFDKLNENKKIVKELRIQYEKNIQNYESELVKNIQIPFYIYSSKILQTRGNESGIYLKVSKTNQHKNYIKFSSSRNDENDAWNKMSSGQLSGLVISLMLTMNKVFPSNFKTLLIDDPVQTMDDINMASLVQLLSHEFNDYQLLLSTHEPRVTSFFKRKFSDANSNVQCINLKNDRSFF